MAKRKRKTTSRRRLPKVSLRRKILKFLRFVFVRPSVMWVSCVLVLVSWLYYGGYYHAMVKTIDDSLTYVANVSGLVVKDVYLEGQHHETKDNIIDALDIKIGQPILGVNIWKIKNRLQELSWVDYVAVERQLPSTLNISIVERVPVALWQHQGKVQLIDAEGQVIHTPNLMLFKDFIILVGSDVPSHVEGIFNIINHEDDIRPFVSSAIRVGERRWNIRLKNGIEIKLPEENALASWRYLAQKHRHDKILESNVKSIDLRVENKVYISMPKATAAK